MRPSQSAVLVRLAPRHISSLVLLLFVLGLFGCSAKKEISEITGLMENRYPSWRIAKIRIIEDEGVRRVAEISFTDPQNLKSNGSARVIVEMSGEGEWVLLEEEVSRL